MVDSHNEIELKPRFQVYETLYGKPTKWVKSKVEVVGDYSIDVQKTNSLISPYTGILIYQIGVSSTERVETRAAAEALFVFPSEPKYPMSYKITFAYQNDKWVPKIYEHCISSKCNVETDALWLERIIVK